MPTIAVTTVFAKRHISLARVLAASLRRHHPDIPFFAVLADKIDGYFDPAAEPFQLVRLEELGIPRLHRLRFHYSQQELTYAVTPSVLRHLLDRGFARAAFLKQESLVLGDLTPVLGLLDRRSIVLTPHLLGPPTGKDGIARELNILQSGVYNVGFLGVSATAAARAFLAWWEERLFAHCRRDVPGGMHFEQRWLDLVPVFFADVAIVRDPGFNVGHWNMPERGAGASFVRFSGFDVERPQAVTRYSPRLSMDDIGPTAEIFRRYVTLLEAAAYHDSKSWPYAYDRFDNGAPVSAEARAMYRELGEAADRFGDPLVTDQPDSFFRWLADPARSRPRRFLGQRVLQWAKREYLNRMNQRGRLARAVTAIRRRFRT
ncbi:MAG TPA: hypothetical protein VGR82_02420 [Methylomirabilota bacterium]|jgi:hypothetical protein|nr:hypothetical protein [Methylomirabilota bacterium]